LANAGIIAVNITACYSRCCG